MKLLDKIAVVTGAGKGIGDSIAHSFVKEGASLVLAARTREQLERVAAEIKTKKREAVAVACDVSSPREVERLAKTAQEKFGRVDILMNNVGISRRSRFLDYEDETWLEVIRINLFGVYLCTKAFLPMMQQTGSGRVINMASHDACGITGQAFNICGGRIFTKDECRIPFKQFNQ